MSNGTAIAPQVQLQTPAACRCADFFLSALSLGYDVAVAATPAGLTPTFRYVANDVCGNAIGLAPAPAAADVHRALVLARARSLGA